MNIDIALLAAIMADFENGKDMSEDNPFDPGVKPEDIPGWEPCYADVAYAFATQAAKDTRAFGGDDTSLVQAGLLQGIALGYEYAKRTES